MEETVKWKLSQVAADCGYVRKDGVNLFHKYNYATAATIFEKVGQALHKYRLVSYPFFKILDTTTRSNAKGGTETLVTVEAQLTIQDIDSETFIETNGLGSGMDNSDKAVMKAQTAALKYAWMMLLNISTGDDPEADATVDSRSEGTPRPKPEPRGPYKRSVELESAGASLSDLPAREGNPPLESNKSQELRPPWETQGPTEETATTQPTDPIQSGPSIFSQKKVCVKCGSEVIEYTAASGIRYMQCEKAREDFLKNKSMATTKGHFFEKKRPEEDPGLEDHLPF